MILELQWDIFENVILNLNRGLNCGGLPILREMFVSHNIWLTVSTKNLLISNDLNCGFLDSN